MTPKEKAQELVQKMRVHSPVWEIEGDAKLCALIAVDEVIKQWEYVDSILIDCWSPNKIGLNYWNQVKQEIEKL